MIIDAQMYHLSQPLGGKTFGLAGLEQLANSAGVDRAVVISELAIRPKNRELMEALAAAADATRKRFTACAWINPQLGDEAVREYETCVKEWGFRELKLMPTHHAFRAVGKAAHPLMRKAEELGTPVMIHSGTFFAHPLEVGVLAEAFPNVPVIMDHMGYRYHVEEAIAAARRTPNLYLETTAVMEPHWIRVAVKELGAQRVIFGSNAPHVYPVTQLLVIRQAELAPQDESRVLGENIAGLLKL